MNVPSVGLATMSLTEGALELQIGTERQITEGKGKRGFENKTKSRDSNIEWRRNMTTTARAVV